MKTLPPDLATHVAGRITTLATCWIVTRADGVRLGFTDHDRALSVEGVECQPQNGLSPSAMNDGPEFAAGGGDVSGTLESTALLKTDLEAGLWDNADVRVFLVNWQTPSEHVLLRRARIGEVGRAGAVFRAELRGLAHLLESRQGRVFARICDADLGDSRCKVDLTNSAYQATATVTTAQREWLRVTGLETYANGWFSRGRVTVLTGPLSVFASEVANHRQEGAVSVLSLFQPAPELLAPGTEVVVRAGCSKDLETCRTKFANHLNYQGFPHMPGSDFALSYPNRNTGLNDGSARVE
ncbi:DUF2163 domain-containing protein [Roseibium alexandrii]|uniref:DUF2163 domain-containing protein n=1 Tax=Roseibium alexandrii TaxID=388408 RepID=UPI0039F09C2F